MKRLVFLTILLVPQLVFGWGREAHMMIAHVGSQLAQGGSPFWKANTSNMMMLTEVPDLNWKDLPTNEIEKPTHFFQPDSYYPSPSQFNLIPRSYGEAVQQRGKEFVDKNGTAFWRVQQFYLLAVQAFRKQDYRTGLEMAGVMSHYIGDMSQPLHDTHNYDGQETGQTGIHHFFETANIAAADQNTLLNTVGQMATALMRDPRFLANFKGSLSDSLFREAMRGYQFKDPLLAMDKRGRSQAAKPLLQLAAARMADGAATLAIVLSHVWADAGNPQFNKVLTIGVPQWVPPNYPLNTK